jgi:hypothetical protein
MSKNIMVTLVSVGLLAGCLTARVFPAGLNGNVSVAEIVAKLSAARIPAIGQPLVVSGQTVCGPQGNATAANMKELNKNKNRTDEPAPNDYVAIDWDDVLKLPPNSVNEIQGAPVSVIGYLSSKVKPETDSPGESTNCNLLRLDEVDWHMYLTKQPAQAIKNAIIVETTPRVRPNHSWTTQLLTPYVNKNKPLRISGWLIYDFQHANVIGKERATVWEVHPITRIETQDADGNWVDVER